MLCSQQGAGPCDLERLTGPGLQRDSGRRPGERESTRCAKVLLQRESEKWATPGEGSGGKRGLFKDRRSKEVLCASEKFAPQRGG